MKTANPKTAHTTTGGNTPTASKAPEVRRVRTAPGQLSDWQEAAQAAPAVVSVTVKPRKVAQVASTTQDLPAWHALSFIKTQRHRHGLHCLDWLAVPAQDYGQGWVTGLEVARELMQFAKCHPMQAQHVIAEVMRSAAQETAKPMTEGADKRGAAAAIMHSLVRIILSVDMVNTGGNLCTPVDRWFQHMIDHQERMNAKLAQEESDRRAAWAKRMQAARKAKQQAQGEATAQGVAA